jgi:hypothetical protein
MMRRITLILLLAQLGFPSRLNGQAAAPMTKLGTVHFATSCSPAAQPIFNRAVALLHSFEFGQAIAGFNATLKADSTCGMAYWGLALSAWSNPFAPGIRSAKQIETALAALQHAKAATKMTRREKMYVGALSYLYEDADAIDQQTRVKVYSDVMRATSLEYPDDIEASIFYALALAQSADPADKTYAKQREAGELLEKLARKYPNHPGLAHYVIHSYDFPPLAAHALHAASVYSKIAPSAPHALHMPSHTFTRVGYWQESIDANRKSKAAAAQVNQGAEELHAGDYMMYAYLQTGQDRAAQTLLANIPQMVSRFDPTKPAGAAVGRLLRNGRNARAIRTGARRMERSRSSRSQQEPIRAGGCDKLLRARSWGRPYWRHCDSEVRNHRAAATARHARA